MKKYAFVLLLVFLATFFSGCDNADETPDHTELPVLENTDALGIYTISQERTEIIQVFIPYEKEITLEKVVSLVTQNMDERVEVSSCYKKGKKAIVSFSNNSAPVKGCNKEIEGLILDCFSNSILDNVKGCNAVIFRGGKGAYKGEHYSFGIDEVYATK